MVVLALSVGVGHASAGQRASKVVRGVVHDSAGAGISRAHVSVAGVSATTQDDGSFSISVASSPAVLTVRRLGFYPGEMEIEPESASTHPIDIALTPIARALEPVAIHARREVFSARLAGFNRRLEQHTGNFITREQIEKNPNARLIDAIRRLPGVRVVTLRGAQGRSVTFAGSNCPPLVFVDGFPATAGAFDLDMIELGSLEGVEVYSTSTSIPPELMGPRGPNGCGVIGLWSSPSRAREQLSNADADDIASLVQSHAVFTPEQVDIQAEYEAGSADPVYPVNQLRARVHGRVVIEFVVDTIGNVEAPTITVVTASNAAFVNSARTAVAHGRFAPAVLNKQHVRQVVRLGLDFDPGALPPPPTDSGPPIPPTPLGRRSLRFGRNTLSM
jgi:TonB family protein